MAHIKCRCRIAYCVCDFEVHMRITNLEECDGLGQCAYEINHEGRGYKRPPKADDRLVNPTCEWILIEPFEFERTVKYYTYDGDLTFRDGTYYENEIIYLEIDGRVLVNEEENR